jgi:PTH1 family peptidyl-tRNA hydrolase
MRWFRRQEDTAEEPDLHLVVGLGNPGAKYAHTRHNIGFMVVDRLAQRQGMSLRGSKQRADVARGTIRGAPTLLAEPVTYMNESGFAVSRLLSYYHVPLDRLLVVSDEIDLPFGTLRIRPSGSAGGHGGLKSIIREVGGSDFARLRIGVGRPPGETVGHVLGVFPPDQLRLLPALVDVAADAVETILTEGVEPAMNRFNRSWLPDLQPAGK